MASSVVARARRALPAIVALTAVLACTYDPRLRSGVIECAADGWCPMGFVCGAVDGREGRFCITAGSGAADAGGGRPDGAPADGGAPPDAPAIATDGAPEVAATPDLAAATPDLATDLAPGIVDAPPPDVGPDRSPDTTPPFACPAGPGPAMVAIDGRWCIDSTEVTNQHYATFLAAGNKPSPAQLPARCAANQLHPDDDTGWSVPAGAAAHPINLVDWCDAYTYCQWAGKRLCGRIGGKELAPADVTDHRASQWLRACSRAGDRAFPYGDSYDGARCDTGHPEQPARTHPVGRAECEGGYPGIFDMAGNVQEWIDACQGADCFMAGGGFSSGPGNGGEESHCVESAYLEPHINHWEESGFRCCAY